MQGLIQLLTVVAAVAVIVVLRRVVGASVTIPENHKGLLYARGKFIRLLEPGRYWLWRPWFHETVVIEDMRLRSTILTGQEIVTKDQINVKMSVAAHYKVVDPVAVNRELQNSANFLHLELQTAIRDLVSGLTLDELLGGKKELSTQLRDSASATMGAFGIEVRSVMIRDVILPGEIKAILAKTLEAERAARSSLITAREELAAARCHANTARLITENPVILRLKELQTISELGKKSSNTIIFASSGDLPKSLVSLAEKASGQQKGEPG